MIVELILNILGVIIFLVPGILLGFIVFPKADVIERSVYSLSLSLGSLGVISIFLYYLGLLNQTFFFLAAALLILVCSFILFKKYNKETHKTEYKKSIFFILFFSFFGTILRYLFSERLKLSSSLFNDSYGYSFKFIGKQVPDLGFYTGMAQDKSGYVGTIISNKMFDYLHFSPQIALFFAVFLFLGFIFLVSKEFRKDSKLAYLGVAIMSLGPIELFYTNTNIHGHALICIVLLPLFLLFKSENKNIYFICLLLSIIMMTSYYTGSVIILLASLGFIICLAIKEFIAAKKIKASLLNLYKNKKVLYFLIIFIVVLSSVFFFSKMQNYGLGRISDNSDLEIAIQQINLNKTANAANTLYKDPTFLYLSAIRWQMLFFFLCGATFIFYLLKLTIKKQPWQEEQIDLFLCLIPVLIISYGLWHVNLPARIFDYFAFFGLLCLHLPKKYFKTIFVICFCFILLTGICVAKDKKVFFESSYGEYLAAKDIKTRFNGKIFSDQTFANQLILNDYYDVAGANDKDKIVNDLFYQTNLEIFLDSINILKNAKIDYIALTKRMREKYVLMLNYPQKAIFDYDFFENNLKKVYDNGDVKIYSTNTKNEK